MKLFNFLKKRDTGSFEDLLKDAATKPEYRLEFNKRLLTEKLVVLTKESQLSEGLHYAQKDTQVNLSTFDDGKVPVFTSADRILDKGIIKEQVAFLELKGEDLFNMVKDKTLILNPFSDYRKEILPGEIENLLKGIFVTDQINRVKITEPTQVKIARPAVYPTEIVQSLNELFSKKTKVNKAYLAWIHNPATTEPPHYIFAIDTEEEWDNLIKESASITKKFIRPDEIVDFMKISNNGGINDYFINSTTPFYKKPN